MASDLIYREDAKVFVRHACYKKINPIDYLDEVPAADVRPVVRAFWVGKMEGVGICSNCKRLDHIDPLATHCRYCGAEITEPQMLKNASQNADADVMMPAI